MGKLPAATILLCLGLLAACTKTGSKPPDTTRPQAPSSSSVEGIGQDTRKPPSQPRPAQPIPQAASTAPTPSPQPVLPLPPAELRGLTALRTLAGTPRLMAEDFTLGPLGDATAGTDEQKEALLAAEQFLSSLVGGSPSPELLSPGSGQAILELLQPLTGAQAAPSAFRLGNAVALPAGELSANIRLSRGRGRAEGEIYLGKEAGRWLVTDVQVNPAALALVHEKPAKKFFPSPYRWLLGE